MAKKNNINWKTNGWTCIQEADAALHILEITCLVENDVVVKVRIRHNDGEEKEGAVLLEGKNALPISTAEFEKLFKAGKLEIR